MRARLFILVAITIAIFGCQLSTPFTEFVSEEGNFSVSMPGTPTEESQTTSDGIEIHTFIVTSGNTTYLVGYSDFPRDIIENNDPDTLLGFAQEGYTENETLLSAASITLDGYPGKSLEIQSSDEVVSYAHFYMVDDRLYQVIASTEDDTMSTEISDFLDSFKLLSKE